MLETINTLSFLNFSMKYTNFSTKAYRLLGMLPITDNSFVGLYRGILKLRKVRQFLLPITDYFFVVL